jgi:hypothetical protein
VTRRNSFNSFFVFAVAVFVVGISTRAFVRQNDPIEPDAPNTVYYINSTDRPLIPLELAKAQMTAGTNSLTGAVEGHLLVQGNKSLVRFRSGERVEFVVRPSEPSQHIGIVFERFETQNGSRILKFVRDPKPSHSADHPGLLAFDSTAVGKSSTKLSIAYNLPEGEYGITITPHGIPPRVYCFGVDAPK